MTICKTLYTGAAFALYSKKAVWSGVEIVKRPQISNSVRQSIREQIFHIIACMDLSVSTRLPSENWLAARLQVSRSTIRVVLQEMETEGKVFRRQGSGTYVNPKAFAMETTLFPRIAMRDIIWKNGYTPSSRCLQVKRKPAGSAADNLDCRPEDPIQEVHSLYLADERPCMYCIDRIREGLITEAQWKSEEVRSQSIYQSIRAFTGTKVCWDMIRIRSVNSDAVPEIAGYLVREGEDHSLVLLEIMNYNERSRPVLYGSIYINGAMIQLNLIGDLTKL